MGALGRLYVIEVSGLWTKKKDGNFDSNGPETNFPYQKWSPSYHGSLDLFELPGNSDRRISINFGLEKWPLTSSFGSTSTLPKSHIFPNNNPKNNTISRWWFHIFFIFIPTRGRFPIWPIFFKWVETTNYIFVQTLVDSARLDDDRTATFLFLGR